MRKHSVSLNATMEKVDGWVVLLGRNDERKLRLLGIDWGKLIITDHGI